MFNNKTILITGGTGSFGQEYKVLLANYNLKAIITSRDENKQYLMSKIKKNVIYLLEMLEITKEAILEKRTMATCSSFKTCALAANTIRLSVLRQILWISKILSSCTKVKKNCNLQLLTDYLYGAKTSLSQANSGFKIQKKSSVVRYGNV